MEDNEKERLANDVQNCILMFQEMEESTANINLKCKEVLRILNNPFLMMMEANKLDSLMNGISFDLHVLNNFMTTFSEMYEEKGEEE